MRATVAILVMIVAIARAGSEPPTPPAAWTVHAQLYLTDDFAPGPSGDYALRLADDRFLLELGPVRVLGVRSPASITAWHTHDPTTIFKAEGDDLAALVRRHLPPIWSTPLARWFTGDPDSYALVGHPWPEQPEIEPAETAGSSTRRAQAVRITAPDEFPTGPEEAAVELVVTHHEDRDIRLEQVYRPVPAGAAEAWGVSEVGRAPVSSIRALRPQPAELRPGDPVRGLVLFDRAGASVDFRRAFEPERTPRGERRAVALLLVFDRPSNAEKPTEVSPVDAIAAARERLAADYAAAGVRRPLIIVRPVAVFDVPDYAQASLDAFARRWEGLGRDALLESVDAMLPEILWTHPPRDSIDRFAPGATAAAVLIDGTGWVREVLRLDTRDANLADWIVDALTPAPIKVDSP